MNRAVAILSQAFRFPQTDTRRFAQDLSAGKDLVTQVSDERWVQERFTHSNKTNPGTTYTHRAGSLGDISLFDASFFGISPREAAQMDPQQRLLLELSWELFENAGIPPSRLRGAECGVYIGIASADYSYRLAEDLSVIDATVATGNTASIAANRLSYFYDLRGPSMAIDTACSSALVAFHQACQAIRAGEITHALTGGVSLHAHPYGFIIFSKASMLSPEGRCNAFDAKGDGYVRSEGGGLFLLKDYELALNDGDDILAVVANSAVNTDGKKSGLTVPRADAQANLLRKTYAEAWIAPDSISYLEAHGTGTAVGDPIETLALGRTLGADRKAGRPLPIGSVKSNLGHLEAASGVAGLAKALHVITTRSIPPTIGIETLNPNIDFAGLNLDVVQENRPLSDDTEIVVGVNSFGFGGANAHIILRQADAPAQTAGQSASTKKFPTLPFVLSAATPEALQTSAQALLELTRDFAYGLDASRYDSLAHHLAHRREWLPQRTVFFCEGPAALQTQLQALATGSGLVKPEATTLITATQTREPGYVGEALAQPKGPVFVFSGNGAQWSGMGYALSKHPVFKDALAEVDALFQPLSGFSIAKELHATLDEEKSGDNPTNHDGYAHTNLAQPALFALQVGIVRVFKSLGLAPQAVAGHSVGEVAAAWAAGLLDLPTAVKVIYHRSRLQETTKGQGKMTAVALDAQAVQALITAHALDGVVHIAGDNSQRGVTLAAAETYLAEFEEILSAKNIGYKRLDLDYAFHSPLMDQIKDPLLDALAALPISPSNALLKCIPFYSVVTGTRLDSSKTNYAPLTAQDHSETSDVALNALDGFETTGTPLNAQYWWDNIRKPVLFKSAIESALQDGFNIFIEIGPHPILQNYLREAAELRGTQSRRSGDPGMAIVMPTLSRQSDDISALQHAAARCAVASGKFGSHPQFAERPRHSLQSLQLPNYPWQKERHWHSVSAEAPDTLNRQTIHPLLGYQLKHHDWTWEQKLDPVSCGYLADHVVGGGTVLPGTAFAEIALAAAKQWHTAAGHHASADMVLRIADLDILSPIVFGSAEQPERYQTRVLRTQLDISDGSLRILSRELLSAEAWVVNAKCRIISQARMKLRTQESAQLDVHTGSRIHAATLPIPLRTPDFDRQSQLQLTRQVGLQYGPNFALIDIGWMLESDGHPCALARFEPTALTENNLETAGAPQHLLHPAVLDCSFQLIIQLLKEHIDLSQGFAFVPTQIGSLWFDGQAGTPTVVQAKLLRRLPHSLLVDFTLVDANGRIACEISDARFKRVRLQKSMQRPVMTLIDQRVAAPKFPELTLAQIDYKALNKAVIECNYRLAQDPTQRAFAQELDPLLDVLCARFAFECLQSKPQANDFAPERLQTLRDFAAQAMPDDGVRARDIWNTLLRDYPDFSHTIRVVGELNHMKERNQSVQHDALAFKFPSPAAFSAEWLGTAGLTQLLSMIGAATQAEALTVLVTGAQCGTFATHVGQMLNHPARPSTAELIYAMAASDDPIQAKKFLETCPEAYIDRADLLSDRADLDTRFVASTDFYADLVIYWANFSAREEQEKALAYALKHTKPGASFLLIGQHPSQWINFTFGLDEHQARTRSGWIATLASFGLEQLSPAKTSDTIEVGPYLLIGQKPLSSAALTDRLTTKHHTSDAPKSWVLVIDQQPEQMLLAERLSLSLQQRGDIASVCVQSSSVPFDDTAAASLLESRSNFGVLDGIVFLSGASTSTPGSPTESLKNNCLALTSLFKACEVTQTTAPVWVITASADHAARAVAVVGSDTPSFANPSTDTVATDTLNVAPLATDALHSAALSGFARSLGNETSAGRIRLIELVSEPTHALFESELLMHALAEECCHPTADNEVVLTHTGARFVSRVRIDTLPAPLAKTYGLRFSQPGQLRNLQWEAIELTTIAPEAIEVAVQATGLNFRDVMYTLGLLSDEALEQGFAGPTLGLEFAGVVTQVGQAVTHLSVGDRVVGFGGACFANRLITPASAAARIPRGLSAEAAATIPSAFLTSYYALHHLAKLAPGERVLIHGAAGGVGLAAIQIARWCGAEIFATAGSDEKRNFLRMLGVHHVLDSRTLSFADDIMDITQGQGVDVVLNSLSGEAIARNLSILKPFGRFLELGKRDFYENTRIGLRPFRLNISYFGIDADQLLSQRPALTGQIFTEVMELFEQGVLAPLPYTRFDASEVIDAFRFMQQSKQIGKVIVTYGVGAPELAQPSSEVGPATGKAHTVHDPNVTSHLALNPKASYLVTGGTRGFGLRTAKWLVDKGARHVALLSRTPLASTDLESMALITGMRNLGATITTLECDITNLERLQACVNKLEHPIKGVVHAAAVIEDSLAINLNASLLDQVLAPKIQGALNLHALSMHWDLDFFVLYSSATTFFGNPGQAAYVAANSWLEALATSRRQLGMVATCMRWGAIEDAGFLARHQHIKDALEQRMGGQALLSGEAMTHLERALLSGQNNVGVLELEWNALRKFLPNASAPRFLALARRAGETTHTSEQATDVLSLVQTLDDKELIQAFSRMIQDELGQILRLDPDKIPMSKSVYDLGLDSLMGVELITALEARFGVRLPVMAISEDSTIERLALRLIGLLKSSQSDEAHAAATHTRKSTDPTIAAIAAVATQHATDTSQEEIQALAQSLNDATQQQTGSLLT